MSIGRRGGNRLSFCDVGCTWRLKTVPLADLMLGKPVKDSTMLKPATTAQTILKLLIVRGPMASRQLTDAIFGIGKPTSKVGTDCRWLIREGYVDLVSGSKLKLYKVH